MDYLMNFVEGLPVLVAGYEDIKHIFNNAKYYEPEMIENDGNGICIEVVFEDRTRRTRWYNCGDVIFSRLLDKQILLEMVPEREKAMMDTIKIGI